MGTIQDDTAPVRAGEDLDRGALQAYVRRELPLEHLPAADRSHPLEIEQFPGGHSNLTYLLRFGARELVLRRPPLGPVPPTAHDMAREYRVLSAVHPLFPLAPRPLLLCGDTSVVGAPFYLMERRRGIVIRRELPAAFPAGPAEPRRISESLVDTLAELHGIDIEKGGIVRLGRPEGFLERQIRGWSGRWERARTASVPEMAELTGWLLERRPEPAAATLVHNDFKLDNVMLDPENPARLVAVLDWEMCTVGDPLVDLGVLLAYWPEKGDSEARLEAIGPVTTGPGWLSRADLVARYAARTGADCAAVGYYEAFALFKVAVVFQQIYFRFHHGSTRDGRFAGFGRLAAGLVHAALGVAGRA